MTGTSPDHPVSVSFELFPPKTDTRRGRPVADRRPAGHRGPRLFLGHLRRRGQHPRPHRPVVDMVGRRTGRPVAHHLTCVGASRDEIDRAGRAPGRRASAGSWRCAAICPRARRWPPMATATRPSWWPGCARRRISTSRSRPTRRCIPRRPARRPISITSSASSTPARRARSRNMPSTPTRSCASSTGPARQDYRADRAGHHAGGEFRWAQALFRDVRRVDARLAGADVRRARRCARDARHGRHQRRRGTMPQAGGCRG